MQSSLELLLSFLRRHYALIFTPGGRYNAEIQAVILSVMYVLFFMWNCVCLFVCVFVWRVLIIFFMYLCVYVFLFVCVCYIAYILLLLLFSLHFSSEEKGPISPRDRLRRTSLSGAMTSPSTAGAATTTK